MKIKLFEYYDQIDLDIYYELYLINKNGDEEEFGLDSWVNDINPYDLREVYNYYKKQKQFFKTLFIKKVTKKILNDRYIEELLTSKKYNI